MKNSSLLLISLTFVLTLNTASLAQNISYRMPEETIEHEGTWLQWPHHYTYGLFYRNSLDKTWVTMTSALIQSEKVHIVAYNESEKTRIINLLNNAGISLSNIDFFIHPNDDVWIRDNGPMFVYDQYDALKMIDWGFNGWGNDTPYTLCDQIPSLLSNDLGIEKIDLSAMVLEGGAIEHDGHGTMMATRSSVTHSSRNPGLSEAQIEAHLSNYMGITNFIWLDGEYGVEITDMHIDGFVKFANDNTILTMSISDLSYWGVSQIDINKIFSASNIENNPYNIVLIPLTQNDVYNEFGQNLGYKGSYVNYYIANSVVLVPNYNDPNDALANSIIQSVHPDRTVIGIDVRNLYENGGMIHCVTQQQPAELLTAELKEIGNIRAFEINITSNIDNGTIQVSIQSDKSESIQIQLIDMLGRMVENHSVDSIIGQTTVKLNIESIPSGIYLCVVNTETGAFDSQKILIGK